LSAGGPVFHVEIKQGFNSARRFNLDRGELDARIVAPWLAGRELELDDRRYLPARSKLKILRGRRIATAEMGLGRGWANAERDGTYVTKAVLAEAAGHDRAQALAPLAVSGGRPVVAAGTEAAGHAPVEAFKAAVLEASAAEPVTLATVAQMAGAGNPRARVSEQLALAERAVWELLHQGRLALFTPEDLGAAPRERWQEVLLAWDSWGGPSAAATTVGALPSPASV
jgi:hypothetical protein